MRASDAQALEEIVIELEGQEISYRSEFSSS